MADLETGLIGDTDAAHWAERFVVVRHNVFTGPERRDIAEDEGAMLAWFASAIETGRMAAAAEIDRLRAELDEATGR